jgi:hypothetical protein
VEIRKGRKQKYRKTKFWRIMPIAPRELEQEFRYIFESAGPLRRAWLQIGWDYLNSACPEEIALFWLGYEQGKAGQNAPKYSACYYGWLVGLDLRAPYPKDELYFPVLDPAARDVLLPTLFASAPFRNGQKVIVIDETSCFCGVQGRVGGYAHAGENVFPEMLDSGEWQIPVLLDGASVSLWFPREDLAIA